MDVETLGAAVKLAAKKTLPPVTASDAGDVMVVGNDGKWSHGQAIESTVSVSGTTLVFTTTE